MGILFMSEANKKRLSKRFVDGLEPDKKPYNVWDTDVRGFHVRVMPSGRKTYTLYYRDLNGKQHKPRIGIHGDITIEEAREIAGDWRYSISKGETPGVKTIALKISGSSWSKILGVDHQETCRDEIDQKYEAIRSGRKPEVEEAYRLGCLEYPPLVSDLFKAYERKHMLVRQKLSTRKNNYTIWNKHILPRFEYFKVVDISHEDMEKMHLEMDDKPTNANRVLEVCKKAFHLSQRWGWRDRGDDPTEFIKAYPERKRKRYLAESEAQRLGSQLINFEEYGGRHKDFSRLIRLLILTGARLSEIMHSELLWVSDNRFILDLPDSKTGEKELMLPAAAMEIIREIRNDPTHKSKYIIPGDASKRRVGGMSRTEDIPMSYPYDLWQDLLEGAEITNLHIHDLRHSFASIALNVTGNLPMVGEMLGHADTKTTARYAHLMDDPKRKAVDASAETVNLWLSGKVVSLADARKKKSG